MPRPSNSSDSSPITGAVVVVASATGAVVVVATVTGAVVGVETTGALVVARETGAGVSGTMIMGAGVTGVSRGVVPSAGGRTVKYHRRMLMTGQGTRTIKGRTDIHGSCSSLSYVR